MRDEGPEPFHAGERAIHARYGIADELQALGSRVIHHRLVDQHRRLLPQLSLLLVATVDHFGRPWASPLWGKPGFIRTPDAKTLEIDAHPLHGDPLHDVLRPGATVGLLGMLPASRRRIRVNGQVTAVDGHVTVQVAQCFGNCPQYIHPRELTAIRATAQSIQPTMVLRHRFEQPQRRLIESADTLFIASAHPNATGASQGADVSHRGGQPGFVRVDDERTLTIPDYGGNRFFNTFGNLLLNPRAGLLFMDFASGDVLYATGRATVTFDGSDIASFEGAERLIRFRLDEGMHLPAALPFRGTRL